MAIAVFTVLYSLWVGAATTHAATGINKQINFQGKLVNANGTNVANGNYNMEFKLYDAASGGTTLWTETRLNNNSQGVAVTDGVFQVNLGSITSLPGSVDFNTDNIYLGINVGNTNGTCTPFSNCSPDGEMTPRIRFTAAPYAFNADALDGLSAGNFVQLAQGAQTDASTTNPSIYINKTGGTADLVKLERSGTAEFVIDTSGNITSGGDITFVEDQNATIKIADQTTADTDGTDLTIVAGKSKGTGTGGDLFLQGGSIDASLTGSGGNVTIKGGAGLSEGTVTIGSNAGSGTIIATGLNIFATGTLTMNGGDGGSGTLNGGAVTLRGGNGGTDGNRNGGNVTISGGAKGNSGTPGSVIIKPQSSNDTTAAFQLQNAAGTAHFIYDSTNQAFALGNAASINSVIALNIDHTYDGGTACAFGCFGSRTNPIVTGSGGTTNLLAGGLFGVETGNTSFTLSNARGISIGNPTKGAASTITNNYGVYVENQTSATNDYGVYIVGADTYALWVDSGTSQFDGQVQIGASDTTGVLLVLDTKTNAGDPTGTNGAMYYNSNLGKFRCYENGAWDDCITHRKVVLGSDVADSSGNCTITNITNLSFSVTSGTTYRFRAQIIYTAAATTTGANFSVNAPTTSLFAYTARVPTTATTDTIDHLTANDGGGCSTDSATTAGNIAIVEGIVTPSASGTLQMRFATEVNTSAITVKAGSNLEWW